MSAAIALVIGVVTFGWTTGDAVDARAARRGGLPVEDRHRVSVGPPVPGTTPVPRSG